jgi:hypothetical protein
MDEFIARRQSYVSRPRYDRRGRGDSGRAGPVSVQHEIDDIAALIETVGGRASRWGWSSGGAVALRAAGADIGVEKLVVYETLAHASRALADVLPNATLRELPGQNHNVSRSAIVPLLAEFVAGSKAVAV